MTRIEIAADTSVVISWMLREDDAFTRSFDHYWRQKRLGIPPIVLTETASGPGLTDLTARPLAAIPIMPLVEGYWWRAGRLRSLLLRAGRKAKLGDALVAQACIDADVPLLTRDRDFRAFSELAGLKIAEP